MANRYVYADNAATTQIDPKVWSAMQEAPCANPSSIHSQGRAARAAIEGARKKIKRLTGGEKGSLYFTSGGTEGNCWALLSGAALARPWGKTHIITSEIEHPSVKNTISHLSKHGFTVTYIPVDGSGLIDTQALREHISKQTGLVSVMHANNETGIIQPVEEIGKICLEYDALFHVDAVQTAGSIPVDVSLIDADMVTISAHKFHGPKGVGAVYVHKNIDLDPLILGGGQEQGKRSGTENVPGIVGMAEALEISVSCRDSYTIAAMRDRLADGILDLPDTRINGLNTDRLPGHVNATFPGIDGEALLLELDKRGVIVSAGSACSAGSMEPSHTLTAMGLSREDALSSIRISLGRENTMEDVEYILQSLREILRCT